MWVDIFTEEDKEIAKHGTIPIYLSFFAFIALHCIALHCIVLYCTALYCTVPYRTALYYTTVLVIVHKACETDSWLLYSTVSELIMLQL